MSNFEVTIDDEYIEAENDWRLHGRILGIYEQSDTLAGKDYTYWIDRSIEAIEFEQHQINTSLGHGFLYRPIPEWLNLVKSWVN